MALYGDFYMALDTRVMPVPDGPSGRAQVANALAELLDVSPAVCRRVYESRLSETCDQFVG
jgi:hypothetical protein